MTRRIRLDDPTAARLDCDAFMRLLADWREGDLRPALHAAADRHVATCAPCAALVADLDALRDAAAALPPLEPSRDLWAGIEARIAPRVVTLPLATAPLTAVAARAHATQTPSRTAVPSWSRAAWAAAAAALLVAGVGGMAWRASRVTGSAPVVAAAPTLPGATVAPIATDDGARAPQRFASAGASNGATNGATTSTGRVRRPASTAVATIAAAPLSPLDAEIATLRRTLATRRATLDTATVRVLETNLAILDGAIRDSRAALVQEPTSRMLHEQLSQALDAKLELMRTAVILSGDD